jgi:hypothetical protein
VGAAPLQKQTPATLPQNSVVSSAAIPSDALVSPHYVPLLCPCCPCLHVAQLQHAVPAFITIVTMPMCYSIAYGVIAGCCSYIVLYLGNFALDLIGVALGKDNMQNVLFNNCPDAFQDKMKVPVPFKSPSAVLQVTAA